LAKDNANNFWIAFRGSEVEPTNWIKNIGNLAQVKYDACVSCKVGSGFKETYDAIRVALINEFKAQVDPLKNSPTKPKVYVTGHSLGGAAATFCAIDVVLELKTSLGYSDDDLARSVIIYTFGSPRVGN